MITAQNLSRNYGDFVAVDQVSFVIPRGSVVGLLGHNGAGKTTIMKMLTGYLEPSSGSAQVDTLDTAQHRLEVQQKIGYLPENSPIYPEMTVIDYLAYVAELRDIPESKKDEVLRRAIQRTQLEPKATSLISTLSRGYRQRVGVAQAVLHEPEILILDEPTNGLDPAQIQEMRSLIRELSERSTVILSTHILQEVEAVCDRVLVISQGKLVLDASLEELSEKNQYLLETDAPLVKVQSALAGIPSVKEIRQVTQEAGKSSSVSSPALYQLSLSDDTTVSPAEITKTFIEKGENLYGFRKEERNLETVFREVSAL
ncbi:ABC transporter ATP-binding protein [bacterium]|nr:ABC transporter ATP-binding protein [bacterium]